MRQYITKPERNQIGPDQRSESVGVGEGALQRMNEVNNAKERKSWAGDVRGQSPHDSAPPRN